MPNPKFRAGGKTYKHNRPVHKMFDGKEYYLTSEGSKKDCQIQANVVIYRGEGNNLARVVKCPKGYEDAQKHPYSLYISKKNWEK